MRRYARDLTLRRRHQRGDRRGDAPRPDGRPHGRGRGRGGHDFKVLTGPGRRVRQGPHHRHADLGGRLHRHRRRRRDDRHAADRRHHVRRLPDASSWTRWSTRPPRSTTCRAASGRCRWSSARRWARRGGRPRSTRSRCTRGRATFPGLKVVRARRRRTTRRGCSSPRSATTTRSSSSSTRSATARSRGRCPRRTTRIPLGVADVKREGTRHHARGHEQHGAGRARRGRGCSRRVGVSAEVVDPRTTWPLDEKTLVESVKKTSRCIVIDEGYHRYGVTGELAAVIAGGRVLRPRRARCGAWARCTCRFRSRRRSRT